MKKLFWKSRTLLLVLSMAMTILVLPSCKSHKYGLDALRAVQDSVALYSVVRSVDTIVVRDSIFHYDSVIYRERTIHDTVYITKEVYRDRLEAIGERQKAVRTDTVVVTEWREKVVEHPPERYVPPFYKRCTIALWVIIALIIGYWAIRRWR